MFGFKAISVHKIVSAVVAARDYSSNLILNLKGDYPFNNNRINVILDRSVNAATVSRAGDGNQQVSSFSPFSSGASYYFDGSGDTINGSSSSALGLGSGDFTIELWTYISTNNTNYVFLLANTYLSDTKSYSIRFGNSGFGYRLQVMVDSSSTATCWSCSTTQNDLLGKWTHIAFTRSSGTCRLFVNGSIQNINNGANPSTFPYTSFTDSTNVGDAKLEIGSGLIGYVSNVRIIKGTALYTSAFTPSTSALTAVANTSLLTCHSSRLFDGSANAADLTVAGNTSASTFSPFDKTALSGSIGNTSVLFDGNGDYLSVPISTGFEFGTGDFTIECWAYRTGAGGGDRFIVSRGNGANFLLRWNSAGVLQFFINASLVNSYTYSFPINNWVHIAVARSGSTCKMFINGVEVSSVSNSANVSAAGNPVLIGGYTSVDFFQGYLSNVRIVKGTAVYTTAFTPPTSALTAISGTSLLACDGTAITDSSSTNATITVAGNAAISTLNPFGNGTGWSAYFDGVGDKLSTASDAAFAYGTGDFTVEFWAFVNDWTTTKIFTDSTSSTQGFSLYISSSRIRAWGNNVEFMSGSTAGYANSQWYHIAFVRSGSTNTIYINGVAVPITAGSATNSTNYPAHGVVMGGYNSGTNSTITQMSNLRIVKGTAVYTATFTPPTSALTAISGTSLLTLQNNTFIDNSSNAFALTPTGDVTMRANGPFGEPDVWSGFFDGTGDILSTPSNTAFALPGDFTVEAWVYIAANSSADGSNARTAIIASTQGYSTGATDGFTFQIVGNSTTTGTGLSAEFRVSGVNTGYSATVTVAQGTWNHIAFVRSGTTLTFYLNGVSAGTSTASQNIPAGGLTIGGQNITSWNRYLNGYISNLRIVKGSALYTSNFAPSTSPLSAVVGTSLLTLQNNAFKDNSSNNFAITRSGDVVMRPYGPFAASFPSSTSVFPGSIYFDGANDYLTIPASAATSLNGVDWTVECWFNPISFGTYNYLIMQNDGTNSGNIDLELTSTGLVKFFSWSTSTSSSIWSITSTRAAKLGAWNHIAVSHVKSSNTTRLFLNGRLEATGTTAQWAGTTIQTCLGNASTGTYQTSTYAKLNGHMTGVRLIKGTALYTSGFIPPSAPPIATANTAVLLNFNDGGTVDSYGSSGAYFTTNAGVVSNTVTKKYGTGSLYFPAVSMTAGPHPDYALGTGDFTIECWLNSTNASNGGDAGIMGIHTSAFSAFNPGAPTGALAGIKFGNASGLINFIIGGTQQTGTISVANATWTHVALCRSAGTVRLFVGGVLSKKVDSSANISGQYLAIGCTIGTAYNMTGYLDNFAIYKGYAKYTTDATFTPA